MSIGNGFCDDLYALELLRPDICDADYTTLQLEARIHTLKTSSLHTYKTYLVFDFYKRNFSYVSNNPLFLFQNSADVVMNEGIAFYEKRIEDTEKAFLYRMYRSAVCFLQRVLPEERANYTLSYNVNVLDTQNRTLLLNNKVSSLATTPTGKLWLVFCTVSLALSQKSRIAIIQNSTTEQAWEYNDGSDTWREFTISELSECERLTIHLSRQGYSVSDIAERLCKSEDAIKKYRKDLFTKLEASNITEAVALAVDMRLV